MPGIRYISGKKDSIDAGQDSPMHPQSRHTHAPLLKNEKIKQVESSCTTTPTGVQGIEGQKGQQV
jgi:hypothetical protein